ncbi:hypothetical protein OG800_49275 (plasmid) [Streptomyces sp. NBC_00445]|uniref:hypothetical protein n=1 Tax=Streptomyces sp. NBC_00445 TaxID=2975745 RepID=UPI002E1ADDE3
MPATSAPSDSDLITSTVATPNLTRPHLIRVCGLEANGDRKGGRCVECGTYGELAALRDLAPSAYGCQPGIESFTSPAPLWR